MRHLVRDQQPPACLGRHRHGAEQWSALTPDERMEIWTGLDAMQHGRCAYCEAALPAENRHIEHFRQRHYYPQGTFDWHNLFGSCNRRDSCGKHKDRVGAYPHQNLIKPDVEDPEHFLLFIPIGSVHARANLSAVERLRAEETIRILHLNGPLQAIRREVLRHYVETAEILAEVALQEGEEAARLLLQEELDAVEQLPHVTAIRHLLTNQKA